ncbi:MAG: lysine exporter LysO family protein [Alicyclobacillus sp.]|nr:lysine exporter LysO family protein [Alicyclobacillus sp.]
MYWFVLTFLCGVAVGRKSPPNAPWIRRSGWLVTPCLLFLILVLGNQLGANRRLMHDLPQLGWQSLTIACLAMAGAGMAGFLAAVWLLPMELRRNLAGRPVCGRPSEGPSAALVEPKEPPAARANSPGATEGPSSPAASVDSARPRAVRIGLPVFILASLGSGCVLGWRFPHLLRVANPWLNVVFAVMLLGIGLALGGDPRFWSHLRQASWRMFVFPFASVVGSGIGGAAGAMATHVPWSVSLGAALGQGWYSLAAIVLNQLVGPAAGTVAFLANVMREILCFVTIPLLAERGRVGPAIAVGGATTMDTTLMLFARVGTSQAGLLYAFVNGALTSAVVPVAIPLVCHWFR